MQVSLFQGPEKAGTPAENLELMAEVAARCGGGLLICPEMFLSGYAIGRKAAERLAEPVDGPSARRAAMIARATGTALLYGYPERGADGEVYNTAILIDREGRTLLNYRKTHLFADLDRAMFRPGDACSPVVELDGFRVGVLICYDIEFPEAVRALALQGAELVAVPTASHAALRRDRPRDRTGPGGGEPGLHRLCQPLRPRGGTRLLRAELHRRARWRRPRPRRARPRRPSPPRSTGPCSTARGRSTPISPTAGRNCTGRWRTEIRDELQPAARRQRDAALRRARHDDAAAFRRLGRGAGCLLRRDPHGHRRLAPGRHAVRAAPDPPGIDA